MDSNIVTLTGTDLDKEAYFLPDKHHMPSDLWIRRQPLVYGHFAYPWRIEFGSRILGVYPSQPHAMRAVIGMIEWCKSREAF